jgi:hypothetical protein
MQVVAGSGHFFMRLRLRLQPLYYQLSCLPALHNSVLHCGAKVNAAVHAAYRGFGAGSRRFHNVF